MDHYEVLISIYAISIFPDAGALGLEAGVLICTLGPDTIEDGS
jgi:hypothetical protein